MANSISTELVVAGLTYAVTKMRGSKKRDIPWIPAAGLAGGASEAVQAVFGEQADDLTVNEATSAGDSLRTHVTGTHGSYTVTISALSTGDPVWHVKRD